MTKKKKHLLVVRCSIFYIKNIFKQNQAVQFLLLKKIIVGREKGEGKRKENNKKKIEPKEEKENVRLY